MIAVTIIIALSSDTCFSFPAYILLSLVLDQSGSVQEVAD